jgi:hypothetical protein
MFLSFKLFIPDDASSVVSYSASWCSWWFVMYVWNVEWRQELLNGESGAVRLHVGWCDNDWLTDWLTDSCTVELTPHSPQSHSTVLVACSSSLKSLPGAPLVSMLAAKSDTHGVCGMWNRMGPSKQGACIMTCIMQPARVEQWRVERDFKSWAFSLPM